MAPPPPRRILVIGGGPAGSTAAYWLAQAGFQVVVAERSTDKFTYGQGIDITGPALQVLRKMGVYDLIRSKVTGESGFALLDDEGEVIAEVGVAGGGKGKGFSLTQEIEVMRGDVTRILAERARESGRVAFRYGCTVSELRQGGEEGMTAVLSDTGREEEFAVVIGADGLMSRTRRMAFPKDVTKNCYKGLDQYTAFFSLPHHPDDVPNARLQHAVRGRAILIRPTSLELPERSSCYMISTGASPALEKALTQSTDEQKALFAREFAVFPGQTGARVLQGMWEAKDFYLAQSAQIKLRTWSHGRVVLVGDAAYCPSPPTGMGTGLAILGSYVLAGELALTPEDPGAAFERYEERLRAHVERAQYVPLWGALPKLGNPQSWLGVWLFRFVFWLIAWSGVWRLVGGKQGGKEFESPEYEFER